MILAGLAAGITALSTAFDIAGNITGYKGQITDLKKKENELKTQQTNLKDSFDASMRQAQGERDMQIKGLDESIKQAQVAQTLNSKQGSQSLVDQSALDFIEMTKLQVEASQAEGQAVQAAATSGFRTNGEAFNAVLNQKQQSALNLNYAKQKAKIQRQNSWNSMSSSFLNSSNQIESYQRSIGNANKQYELMYGENGTARINYNQANAEYNYLIGETQSMYQQMEKDEWWASWFKGGLDGANGLLNAAVTYKEVDNLFSAP